MVSKIDQDMGKGATIASRKGINLIWDLKRARKRSLSLSFKTPHLSLTPSPLPFSPFLRFLTFKLETPGWRI